MKFKAELVGVSIGHPHGIERPQCIYSNQIEDCRDWGRKTLAKVNLKHWPNAQVLIYETVETVVDKVNPVWKTGDTPIAVVATPTDSSKGKSS